MTNSNTNKETLKVLNPIENENGKTFWIQVGIAFTNRDGSINVKLNCLPLNGRLQIRKQDREPGQEG